MQRNSRDGEVEFWSHDLRHGVRVEKEAVEQIRQHCVAAGSNETGGILAGFYTANLDCAVVTNVTGPTPDSTATRTSFIRGVKGVKQWLAKLWSSRSRRYFLGEWHFHPFASAFPSVVDDTEMNAKARDAQARCPEPVLIILGGDPKANWQIGVYVYRGDSGRIVLNAKPQLS